MFFRTRTSCMKCQLISNRICVILESNKTTKQTRATQNACFPATMFPRLHSSLYDWRRRNNISIVPTLLHTVNDILKSITVSFLEWLMQDVCHLTESPSFQVTQSTVVQVLKTGLEYPTCSVSQKLTWIVAETKKYSCFNRSSFPFN